MENLSQQTDDQLVVLYSKGNNKAFDTLLERYKSKLYSYIFYTIHDEDAANDIFQETFIKIITCIQTGKYAAEGKFQAWMRRIAHNMIMDFYRQHTGENFTSDDIEDDESLTGADIAAPSIESQSIHDQTLEDVQLLYKMLPEVQSQVVFMRFYQNLSFKEIAAELGISINTALGRMRYALINIRKIADEKNISLSWG